MSPITHLLTSWSAASCFKIDKKDRILATIAGVVPDIDGIGIGYDLLMKGNGHVLDLWSRYHHTLGHNIGFGLLLTITAFLAAGRRWVTSGLVLLADMPLKEKAAIANLDEDKVPYLQYVNNKIAPKVVVEKKGKTQGAGLARNRDRDSEQFNYQSFLYQLSSAQCGINAFSCLLSRFYADRPKFNEMIIIRHVILLNWCQTLPVSQFLSG